jgi:hypothetical protein
MKVKNVADPTIKEESEVFKLLLTTYSVLPLSKQWETLKMIASKHINEFYNSFYSGLVSVMFAQLN